MVLPNMKPCGIFFRAVVRQLVGVVAMDQIGQSQRYGTITIPRKTGGRRNGTTGGEGVEPEFYFIYFLFVCLFQLVHTPSNYHILAEKAHQRYINSPQKVTTDKHAKKATAAAPAAAPAAIAAAAPAAVRESATLRTYINYLVHHVVSLQTRTQLQPSPAQLSTFGERDFRRLAAARCHRRLRAQEGLRHHYPAESPAKNSTTQQQTKTPYRENKTKQDRAEQNRTTCSKYKR